MESGKGNKKRGSKKNNQNAAPASSSSTTTTEEEVSEAASTNAPMGGARFHCNYCEKDISSEVRIKCAQCQDFDLCVDCFYVGVEVNDHKNTHPYRVMDDMSAPIYTTKWGADEELLLLEGIELFGLGNWTDIADHVGTKNKFECEYHYWLIYIDCPTAPLPNNSAPLYEDAPEILEKDVKKDDYGLLFSISEKIKRRPMMIEMDKKMKAKIKKDKTNPQYQELEFLPLRGDFTVEYDNDAEEKLALLEITPKDTKEEREFKLKILASYAHRLDERIKRKEFAISRNIIDWKKLQQTEKKLSKEDKELNVKYRPFARFAAQQDFEEFIQGLSEERKIRQRIEQLKYYRTNGITSLGEAERFEQDKKKREEDQRKLKKDTSFYHKPYYKKKTYGFQPEDVNANDIYVPTMNPIEIQQYPGAELLSQREKELCASLRLQPKQYLVVKDVFIRENFKYGYLTKTTAFRLLQNMDKQKVIRLYEFFVLTGCITLPQITQA